MSYTRKQKLAAIVYATTTYVPKDDGTYKKISIYRAAKNLSITEIMLKRWIKDRSTITA